MNEENDIAEDSADDWEAAMAEQAEAEGTGDNEAVDPDELIAQVQFWMTNNLSTGDTITELANQFNISSRSLTRRFKKATGMSCIQHWQQLRLSAAKDLLTSSNFPLVDDIKMASPAC